MEEYARAGEALDEAKLLDEDQAGNHTRSGVAMGTPTYMSPEQVRDAKTTDQRTDIFSLGAMLILGFVLL